VDFWQVIYSYVPTEVVDSVRIFAKQEDFSVQRKPKTDFVSKRTPSCSTVAFLRWEAAVGG
jgi:hypothetical protein